MHICHHYSIYKESSQFGKQKQTQRHIRQTYQRHNKVKLGSLGWWGHSRKNCWALSVYLVLTGFPAQGAQGKSGLWHRGDSEACCPFCSTPAVSKDPIPAPVHVFIPPSPAAHHHWEHPAHLLLMNYTEGRSRYISSLSIIQRCILFFFFFCNGTV